MKPMHTMPIALLAACAVALSAPVRGQEISSYRMICDASAAVALDAEHFVVADDEHNVLQIYKRGTPAPVGEVPLAKFLGTKKKESDLEGAAAIGKRIYWISSHGRNKDGEVQERRYRFFATELKPGKTPRVKPVGQAYTGLLDDLLLERALVQYGLDAASQRAPEAVGGLNIEGLAATLEGDILIGFRNPLTAAGRALIVPLKNPKGVVNGKKAKFGVPIELDLDGRGIRSIEWIDGRYLIVAGPTADDGTFALFRWSGNPSDAPAAARVDLKELRPEALFAVPGTGEVQLLSDDGGVKTDGVECKDLAPAKRSFRSLVFRP
jgi:hypothetical protein